MRRGGRQVVTNRLTEFLKERFPALADWLDRGGDRSIPAIGLSVATHAAIFFVFGSMAIAVHEESRPVRELIVEPPAKTTPLDLTKIEPSDTEVTETARETTLEPVAGSFSPDATALISTNPVNAPVQPPRLAKLDVPAATKIVLPTATKLDQTLSIKGDGSEHVGGVEGAVDRVALEILRRLESGRTLVVWAFDASGSLQDERERLAGHIKRVYDHVRQYDKDDRSGDEGLLTIVVGFGETRKAMTREAVVDPETIASAIRSVPLDSTGIENTFGTVSDIVRRWGKFKKNGKPYHLMVIVVTDEVGDDENRLEEAVSVATTMKVPVFVLGSPALFGRVDGFMDYTDPKTKRRFYHLPVRQGPESVVVEQIRLPFWYDGPQYEFMDAGFGPYALSRLAGATGGIYFVTRMGGNHPSFDPNAMREYRPDWVSRAQYESAIARDPLRQAVITAGQISQQNLPGQPGFSFPPADSPEFKDVMAKNQEIVARVEYTVDEALRAIAPVSKLRDHETSRRWQAHYDLIRGRLLAVKIRCHGYNALCAQMKKDPLKFSKPKSNAWRIAPDAEISYGGAKVEKAVKEAVFLLKRVVTEHAGTPWALLAQRELKDPLGFKWVETYVPPPPKPKPNENNPKKTKKNNNPPPKPPEPPKL